jgi:hypothetical protein
METRKFNRKEIVRTCCAAIKNKYGIKPPLKSIKLIDFNEDGGYTKFSINGVIYEHIPTYITPELGIYINSQNLKRLEVI